MNKDGLQPSQRGTKRANSNQIHPNLLPNQICMPFDESIVISNNIDLRIECLCATTVPQ